MARVIVLAGPICAGKTTLANGISERLGFDLVAARDVLRALAARAGTREELQRVGRALEERTAGRWLADAVAADLGRDSAGLVIDSARTVRQLTCLQSRFNDVIVIYVDADSEVRRVRFEQVREDALDAGGTFAQAEGGEERLLTSEIRPSADLVIDTTSINATQAVNLAESSIRAT